MKLIIFSFICNVVLHSWILLNNIVFMDEVLFSIGHPIKSSLMHSKSYRRKVKCFVGSITELISTSSRWWWVMYCGRIALTLLTGTSACIGKSTAAISTWSAMVIRRRINTHISCFYYLINTASDSTIIHQCSKWQTATRGPDQRSYTYAHTRTRCKNAQ